MTFTIDKPMLERITKRINPRFMLADLLPQRGGLSAQVVMFEVVQEDGTRRKLLLRAHGDNDRIRNPNVAKDEFNLLQHLHRTGLPVPEPHLVDDSGDLLPVPYIVVDFIEGKTVFSPPDVTDYVRQCAAMLARVHQVPDVETLAFLFDQAKHALWWIRYEPETLDASMDEPRLRETLRQLFPLKQVNKKVLMHGDFWMGNLIWRDEKLAGVIDWEDTALGDPLADLAITRLEILWAFGEQAMHDFTNAYFAQMPHVKTDEMPHWELFAALRPAGQIGEWAAQWPEVGRPDVTEAALREKHAWYVKQAFEKLEG